MRRGEQQRDIGIPLATLLFIVIATSLTYAQPEGPSSVTQVENRTATTSSAQIVNTSGGVISVLLLNASSQNNRWKAHIGNVTGTLSLSDSSGFQIYDWNLDTSVTGEVYATRNDTTIAWANIACANESIMEGENVLMNHTNPADNITATFNGTTHASFTVASTTFSANACPTTNTYVNSSAQDASFEEMVLWDGQSHNLTSSGNGSVVYATIIENDVSGYDNAAYDFQMIVPENGADSFTSSTAYYFYIEVA